MNPITVAALVDEFEKIAKFDWKAARESAVADSFPAVGSVLGAGIASGMSNEHRKINPLSGAAIGYGVGGLAEMAYHHLSHKKHASVEKTSGKKIRAAIGALGAVGGGLIGHGASMVALPHLGIAAADGVKSLGGSAKTQNKAYRATTIGQLIGGPVVGGVLGYKGVTKLHDKIEKKLQDRKAAKDLTKVSYVDSALSVFNKVSALSMSSGQTGWGQMASSAGSGIADAAKAKARNLAAAAARNQSLAGHGATAFQQAAQALPVVKGRLLS